MRDPQSDSDHLAAILVFTAAVAFAVSPFFTSGFNGFTPDQFPVPQDDPPIQPAGWAFSIWGPIYLWLLAHVGYGLFRRADDPDWRAMRWPLFVSLAVGASWIAVAQVSPVAATLLIWIMLIAALAALFRAPRVDRWWAQAPVALYAGWLTAASWVALGLTLAGHGVLLDATGWGYAALIGALVTALAVQTAMGRAPEYSVAVVWALAGVAAANWGASTGMVVAAAIGAALIAGSARRAAMAA